jgi:hypothetical protein
VKVFPATQGSVIAYGTEVFVITVLAESIDKSVSKFLSVAVQLDRRLIARASVEAAILGVGLA